MSTILTAEHCSVEFRAEKKTIRPRKVIKTTLGDLVAAVTDEVKPFVRDPSSLYAVVSYILNDLLTRYYLRAPERLLRKRPGYFAQEVRALTRPA